MTTITKKTTLLPLPVPTWTCTWCPGAGEDPSGYVPNVGTFEIRGTNLDCFAVGDTIKATCNGTEGAATVTAVTPTAITVEQSENAEIGKSVTYTKTIAGVPLAVTGEVIGV